jgi:molecular chaperone GrpE
LADEKKTDPIELQNSQRAIDEAVPSVERVAAEPEAPGALSEELSRLRADLLQARQALRQREAELELSQRMGRQTLEKLKDEHERALRALADLDNLRKRAGKERDEQAKFSQEKLLRDLLPVLDNLDRALDHAAAPSGLAGLASGIRMTRKLLEELLARHGVRAVEAVGKGFDPRVHEAMQSVESAASPGTVLVEMVRGYTLHERLLRPAMVVVSRAPQMPSADPPEAAPAAGGAVPLGEELVRSRSRESEGKKGSHG